MKIGYAKLGRSIPLTRDRWGFVGGDDEPMLVLQTLARRHPEHEFTVVGKCSADPLTAENGFPSNVTNSWDTIREEVRLASAGSPSPLSVADKQRITRRYMELVQPIFSDLDGLIIWTGQHGTSNNVIPKVGRGWDDVTSPQDAFIYYGSYLVAGINIWRSADPVAREEVWLCPDARNYVKARDLKWPLLNPVLGQFDWTRQEKNERWGDTRQPAECGFPASKWEGSHVWVSPQKYVYSRLEICGITPEHMNTEFGPWEGRKRFGLFINEARAYVKHNRFDAMRDWVLPLEPDFVHGQWPKASQEKLGRVIEPAPFDQYYDILRSVACSFTTPTSGTGWATTKPWQSFATGTVIFFHPQYDTQGNVIPTLKQVREGKVDHDDELKTLATWLRVETPEQLAKRVDAVSSSRETWEWLATAQRRMYDRACTDMNYLHMIERRVGLRDTSTEPWAADGRLEARV